MRRFGSWLGVMVLMFSLLLPTSSYVVPQVAEAKEPKSKKNVDFEQGFTFENNKPGREFISVGDKITGKLRYRISHAPDNGKMHITLQRYYKGKWEDASDTFTKDAGSDWKEFEITKDKYGKNQKIERGAMYRLYFNGPNQNAPTVNNQIDYKLKQNENTKANIASRIEIRQNEVTFENNWEDAYEWTSNGKPIVLNVWYDIARDVDIGEKMKIQLKRWEGGQWKVVWDKGKMDPKGKDKKEEFTITEEKEGQLQTGQRYKLYFDAPDKNLSRNRVTYDLLQLDAVHGTDESKNFDLAPKKLDNESFKMVMNYTKFSDKTGKELKKDLKMKGEVEFTYKKPGKNESEPQKISVNKSDQTSFTLPKVSDYLPKAGEKKPNYTEIAMTFGGMIDKLQVNKQYQVKNRLKLGHQSGSKLKFKKVKRNKDNDIELEVEGSLKDIDGVWTISLLDTDDNRLLSNKPIQVKGKGDKLKTKIDGESASTYHDEIKFEVTFQAVKVDNQIQAEKEGSWDSAIFYDSKGSKTVKFGDSSSTGGSSSGSDKGSSGGSDGGSSAGDDQGGDDKGGTSDGDDQGEEDKDGSSAGDDKGGDDKGGSSAGDDQGGDDKGGTSDGDDQGGDDKGGTSDGDDQGEEDKDGSSDGTDQSGDDEGGNDDSNDNGDSSEAIPVTIEASHSIDKQGNLVITATLKDVEKAKGNWKITYDQQSEEVEGGQKISYIIEKSKLKNGTTPLTLEFTGLADGKKVSGKLELDVEVQGVEDNETTDDGSGNTNDSNDSTETGNDDTDNDNGNTSNTPTSSNGSTTIGGPLPKTANTYPFLLALGTACMVLGGTVWYYMRRKTQ